MELGPGRFLELKHQLGRDDARVLQLGPRQWRPTHGRGDSNGSRVGRRLFGSPSNRIGTGVMLTVASTILQRGFICRRPVQKALTLSAAAGSATVRDVAMLDSIL
jgi:hypothetical protein